MVALCPHLTEKTATPNVKKGQEIFLSLIRNGPLIIPEKIMARRSVFMNLHRENI